MRRTPPATAALVAVSTAVYLAMTYLDHSAVVRPLLISAYTQPTLPEIRAGEWWRLATPMFLHFGLFHLVFNMLWTWELGRVIESRHGAAGLLALTAVVGVGANLAQYWVAGPLFGGMSGVVYGYFGYLWIQGVFNPAFGFRLAPPVVYLLLGWFALGMTDLLEVFNLHIANTAHAAGLVGGVMLALLFAGVGRARAR